MRKFPYIRYPFSGHKSRTTSDEFAARSFAQAPAKNSNIFKYFQTFRIIFRIFSNIFKRFQSFSNVFKRNLRIWSRILTLLRKNLPNLPAKLSQSFILLPIVLFFVNIWQIPLLPKNLWSHICKSGLVRQRWRWKITTPSQNMPSVFPVVAGAFWECNHFTVR